MVWPSGWMKRNQRGKAKRRSAEVSLSLALMSLSSGGRSVAYLDLWPFLKKQTKRTALKGSIKFHKIITNDKINSENTPKAGSAYTMWVNPAGLIFCASLFYQPCYSCLHSPSSPQISTLRRQGRTLFSTVPETAEKEAHSLFVQEVKLIHTWIQACFVCSLSPDLGQSLNLSVVTEARLYPFVWSAAMFSLLFTQTQVLCLFVRITQPSFTPRRHTSDTAHKFRRESSQGFILICPWRTDKAEVVRCQWKLEKKECWLTTHMG